MLSIPRKGASFRPQRLSESLNARPFRPMILWSVMTRPTEPPQKPTVPLILRMVASILRPNRWTDLLSRVPVSCAVRVNPAFRKKP